MNWAKQSEWLMSAGAYKVAKFLDCQFAQYRASRSGQFIGMVVASFEAAAQICENNHAIMGDSNDD